MSTGYKEIASAMAEPDALVFLGRELNASRDMFCGKGDASGLDAEILGEPSQLNLQKGHLLAESRKRFRDKLILLCWNASLDKGIDIIERKMCSYRNE